MSSSTEIQIQEHRSRMYKHANRPVPLQNIRLNFTENPYHRVIRGNTYNLRTTSSGIIRLNSHLSTPQHEPLPSSRLLQQRNQLHFHHPPQPLPSSHHQSPHSQMVPHHVTPIRQLPKRQAVRQMRRARIMTPHEAEVFMPMNRKSMPVQTEDTEVIELLRPEIDAEVQTEERDPDSPTALKTMTAQYREALSVPTGVDKSTQVFPEDPDIFVFDKDVQEILEKLVGSTLLQCMGEVLEEEEINSITRQNKHHKVKTRVLLNDR